MNKIMKKNDKHTGEEFIAKRSNQIFANPKNRSDFNNNKANINRKEKNPTQFILNKNREILKRILGDKKYVEVSEDFLRGAQFDFRKYTSADKTRDGKYSIYLIFDYALIQLENNKYKIEKNV